MEAIYPKAQWRPLSPVQTEPSIGIPRLLIVHTMVGGLMGTERMFKENGYEGVESTFGLGGPWDGSSLDGVFFQWQLLSRQADANYKGNALATSIECSDGGNASRGFSDKQIASLIDFHVWWCKQTGNPAVKATRWDGHGFGYHRMFNEWNHPAHDCPGDSRARQLENEIWPEAARRVKGQVSNATPVPAQPWMAFPLGTDQYYGYGGIVNSDNLAVWQRQMASRGWSITADGSFGPETEKVCKQFQKEKGLGVDGRIGLQTWNKAWTSPVT